MSNIINKFDAVCAQNADKPAFIFTHKNKLVSKTFSDLYNDVFKSECVLRADGVKENSKILLFAPSSYKLYVFMLASLKVGASPVCIDERAKREDVEKALAHYRPDYIAVTHKTNITRLRFPFSRKIEKVINVGTISRERGGLYEDCNISEQALALSTITTGVACGPKIITRTHKELYKQLMHINQTVKKGSEAVVLTASPIHVFDNILRGITSVLFECNAEKQDIRTVDKNIKLLSSVPISVIIAPPDFCLQIPNVFPNLKVIYLEGSVPSLDEAKEINKKFIKSNNYFIYGSAECHIISGVKLKQYINILEKTGRALLGQTVKGVKAITGKDDEILISSGVLLEGNLVNGYSDKTLASDGNLWCCTGDAGTLTNNIIEYRGRKYTN